MLRSWSRGRGSRVAAVTVLVLVATLVTPSDAGATSGPPPAVSRVTALARTAHQLSISYSVPAAYYHPGAGGVVRLTRGYTPAPTPTTGYAVPVSGHVARTNPGLGADLVYTFAIWVRDNGVYSARRTITLRTRPDDVSALSARVSLGGPTFGPFGVRVTLTWHNPAGPPLGAIRIVRNTAPTTTGGKVINLPGSAQSYVDTALPAGICSTATGCSTAPIHYWVLARSASGDVAEHYRRFDAVVGSRTITGTVSAQYRNVEVFCCLNPIDGSATAITSVQASPSVNGGAFTAHVPPGVYTVCTNGPTEFDNLCWTVAEDGTGSATPWLGFLDTVPAPTVDVVTSPSYSGIDF